MQRQLKTKTILQKCPEDAVSPWQKFFFTWVGRLFSVDARKTRKNSLLKKASKETLSEDDVWDINPRDKTRNVSPVFDRHWYEEKESRQENDVHIPEKASVSSSVRHRKTSQNSSNPSEDTKSNVPGQDRDSRITKHRSLILAILKSFWRELLVGCLSKQVHFASVWISSPFLTGILIENAEDADSPVWIGVSLSLLLIVILIVGRLFDEQCIYTRQRNNLHIVSVLNVAIFRKALNLHPSSRRDYSVGKMTNLLSGDCTTVSEKVSNLLYLLNTPVMVVVIFWQLFRLLGPPAGFGLFIMFLLMPFNKYVSDRITKLFEENAKHKDEKMKQINEVLTGMKVLKLLAWEKCFGDMIRKTRSKEMKILTKMTFYRTLHIISWNTAPFIISMAMFAGFVMMYPDATMTAKTAFSVISSLDVLRLSINQLPDILSDISLLKMSLRRIEEFLVSKETEQQKPTSSVDETGVTMQNGTFTWDTSTLPAIRNICLNVQASSLVAVVGKVGAGKSSILSAFLGEMEKMSGSVAVQGKLAYVPQQAWIQNDTLQNNILFGKSMDRCLYQKVIEACALQPDLDLLPAGDQTEIGERGINLSGGQKQRVSLARAVYNDADVYLLDDPLSAVDSHVRKHLVKHVLQDMLKDKVRLLVTHDVLCLPEVDDIVVIEEGEIVETGSFKDLVAKKGVFTRLLRSYLTEYEENNGSHQDSDVESEDDEGKPSSDLVSTDIPKLKLARERRTSRQRSRTSSSSSAPPTPSIKEEQRGKIIEEEKVDYRGMKLYGLYAEYVKVYGGWNMVLLLFFYVLYYLAFVRANILLVRWTSDPMLRNISRDSDSPEQAQFLWQKKMNYLSLYYFHGLLMCIFITLYSYMMSRGIVRTSLLLHENMLTSILRSPMRYFDTTPVGRLTNRFSHDMKIIDEYMPSRLEYFLDCVVNVVVSLLVVLYTTPQIIIIVIPVLAYYIPLQSFIKNAKNNFSSLMVKAKAPVESHFTESVMGCEVIRAFGHQERFIARLEDFIDNLHRFKLYNKLAYRWLSIHMLGVGYIVCGMTSLFAVVYKSVGQAAGLMGLGLTFSLDLNFNMRSLVLMWSDVETSLFCVARVLDITSTANEADWRGDLSQCSSDWPESGKIEFRKFSLRYRSDLDLVLRNISFCVQHGEKIGVVGRTGAGKSSLVTSLFRLVEATKGEIFIDDVNIASLGLHDLREKIAIIPQDPVLFTGSLRMNLDPSDNYTDAELWTALDHAHMRQFVESLPNRLQSECGEGGTNFSVGQRQLFCLSRTLLRKSKILILDEATAAVDMETDDLIQQTIRSEFKDCTVLTIAHRINTILDYDRVLVLDNGRVMEFDSVSSLMQNKNGVFYGLAKACGLVN